VPGSPRQSLHGDEGEEAAGAQRRLLGPARRPVGGDKTVPSLAADGLLEALCRMGTCQVFMHELHLIAPVRDVGLEIWSRRWNDR